MLNNSQVNDAETQSPPGHATASPRTKVAPRIGRASKLRLLARLHGEGLVTWSGAPVRAIYDLDVFGGGASRTASGFLEGDFAAAQALGQDETAPPATVAARLRLENGGELAIQIFVVASDLAEFEAPLTPAQADLLSAPS